ncbi:hypothetical protein PBI_LUCKY2013_50 [Mycobacterium phage Lucky2013]|uniref:Uncharacterized protein n=2 Tax=Omegavirus courthouse TaxID=1089119 RepID=G8I5A7_9CAUD|nr:minor tail protein [Mycobacterium phage Courthouse]YP_009205180.1 minor tail protein [Mycobacterium phage Ariel]YP_009213267.1 minor tail protein [Mycobacterium phage MiaZeal]ASD50687.1 hypothetical protein PORCELAIN_49 [Mycobacterium phage Porcelain]ASD53443.1 hypothetical protein PBI_LUCKY2013_50 [Mycobacterium phage Lucky2013]ASZ74125.1 hypothetical protein SEA_SQUINT_49 [Mycobacterium phage Squint]ATS92893.1 hypothetical protein SEA_SUPERPHIKIMAN_50 [Mycobacterium phage Superphikiman]
MDAPAYEPTGWFGMLPWLLYAVPFLVPTLFIAWGQWKARRHNAKQAATTDELKQTIGAIRNNVQNGHKTLMRDDLDELVAGIKELRAGQETQGEMLNRMDRRLDRIAEDLSTERQERIAGDRRSENCK